MGLSVDLTKLKRDLVDVLANTGVGGAGTGKREALGPPRQIRSHFWSLAYLLLHSHCSNDVY